MIELSGDSGEYEFLEQAVELSSSVGGVCCEIGLRMGFGTKIIIDAVRKYCPTKTVISIDPYGSILYQGREMNEPCRLDYTNEMKYRCLSALYTYLIDNPVDYHYYDLEDNVFFDKYKDGIVKYELEKIMLNTYSVIHFDGPHTVPLINKEIDFFLPRTNSGGCWVFDDCTPDFYDHDAIEKRLFEIGFILIKKGNKKALYQKI